MKKVFVLFLGMTLGLLASSYKIKIRGVKMGEIETLQTLKSDYLKAKASNFTVRLILGEDNFVLYANQKPDIKDAVYKEDKTLMLYAVKEAMDHHPKEHIKESGINRRMELRCSGLQCQFNFTYKGKLRGKGYIIFDENQELLLFKDDISTLEISKI